VYTEFQEHLVESQRAGLEFLKARHTYPIPIWYGKGESKMKRFTIALVLALCILPSVFGQTKCILIEEYRSHQIGTIFSLTKLDETTGAFYFSDKDISIEKLSKVKYKELTQVLTVPDTNYLGRYRNFTPKGIDGNPKAFPIPELLGQMQLFTGGH